MQETVTDAGSIPGSGRSPGGGNGNPLQYSCLENPHGYSILVGYRPRGCRESDMTEATEHVGRLLRPANASQNPSQNLSQSRPDKEGQD